MPLIRSISGLRGTLGDSLTPDVVARYASAFAEYCGGTIVVGRDGRPSGEWIEQVVAGTLRACGVDVELLGVAPTPTVQLSVEKTAARGGIAITASHNPSEWNGLKFLNGDGVFLDGDECAALFDIVDGNVRRWASAEPGAIRPATVGLNEHMELALALPMVDVERIRARRFRVVVDAVNASGSVIVPQLLEALGCEVVPLFCDGTGTFPHTPEPLPENLTQLAGAVREGRADLGVAVDPDADRLVLIDETGAPIGEEYTITIAADYVLGWTRHAEPDRPLTVAVNLSTTRAVNDVAARHGATLVRTAVGEINVARRMRELGAVIGGEGSGGVILPALHLGRDSLAGIVLTLSALASTGLTLSQYRASLPSYTIVKKKLTLPPGIAPAEILQSAASALPEGTSVDRTDGVRIDYDRAWIHMRGSNTEPIVRVIAEAPTREQAEALAEEWMGRVAGE